MENATSISALILILNVLLYGSLPHTTTVDADTSEDSQALVPRRLNMDGNTTKEYDVPPLPYWLGFSTLNALGKSREAPKELSFSLDNPIAKDMKPSEASKCMGAISSYPYVVQKMWSNI